jgi:hypothetical protein
MFDTVFITQKFAPLICADKNSIAFSRHNQYHYKKESHASFMQVFLVFKKLVVFSI